MVELKGSLNGIGLPAIVQLIGELCLGGGYPACARYRNASPAASAVTIAAGLDSPLTVPAATMDPLSVLPSLSAEQPQVLRPPLEDVTLHSAEVAPPIEPSSQAT